MCALGDEVKNAAQEHIREKAARDILTGIEEWRGNKIKTAKRRWTFELIQNAIDTAKGRDNTDLKIEINNNNNQVTFKHNGGCFKLDEISAVIYGGSTKPYEAESEYVGRFGTGFLVSHIVSRIVDISGFIKKENKEIHQFEMELNRKSDIENKISNSIQDCFLQLNNAKITEDNPKKITEFTFNINDEKGKKAMEKGIQYLKKNIPYVFAFNDIIKEITINGESYQRKKGTEHIKFENEGFDSIKPINVKSTQSNSRTVLIKKDEDVVIGLPIEKNEISSLKNIPNIYVGMPLIETADFLNIPFLINSLNFEPTKERDGLSSDKDNNYELISRAFELYKEMIKEISKIKDIEKLFRTIDVDLVSDDEASQNPLWEEFNKNIKTTFEFIIKKVPIVKTTEKKERVEDVFFPNNLLNGKPIDQETFNSFYELISEIKKKIPITNINNWRTVIQGLKDIESLDDFVSLYGIKDMRDDFKDFVDDENFKNLKEFGEKYSLDNPKQYLLSFTELTNNLYVKYEKEGINHAFLDYLLPSQKGIISPTEWDKGKLHIDENISDGFKDICKKIGWEIRRELIDEDFAEYVIVKDLVKSEMDINDALNKIIRNEKLEIEEDKIEKNEWEETIIGWVELLKWCVENEKIKKGIPVITKNEETRTIENLEEEFITLPFEKMGFDKRYEDIFPEKRVMHKKYFDAENSQNIIEKFGDFKLFVTELPVYRNNMNLKHEKLESILVEENDISKVDHVISAEEKIISTIPFLENEILGKVSKYKDRGKLLFEFVINCLIEKDESWNKSITINCECEDKIHEIKPSKWLASLKSDAWVPYETLEDEEKNISKMKATKETIEHLLTSTKLDDLIKSNPDKIIDFLPHFGFDELDLKIKKQSIKDEKPEKKIRKKVSEFIYVADVVPDLPNIIEKNPAVFQKLIEDYKDKLERESLQQENKIIGENIEKIIKKIISKKSIDVKSIYKGGDLEIWSDDLAGWDSGTIELKSQILEVKFTSGSQVHLSRKQSEKARKKGKNYKVLVVENAEDLRSRLLTELDEQSISDEIISIVKKNSYVVDKISTKLGDIPDPEIIEPEIKGYWLKMKLWADKNHIHKWLEEEFK